MNNDKRLLGAVTLNPIPVTRQLAKDILTTAFEGGINYWCDCVKTMNPDGGPATSNFPDHAIEVMDAVEGRTLILNHYLFLHGLEEWAQRRNVQSLNEDTLDYDAGDADDIIQFALFGEIVYR